MPFSFLQGVGAAPTGAGTTVAVTITVVAQHAVIGHATMDTTNTTSVSVADNTPTACNSDVSHNSTGLGQVILAYSLPNSPGGSRTFTATFGASSNSRGISACEFNGAPRIAGSFVTGTPASNDGGAGTASAYDAATSTTPLVHNALIFEIGESGLNLPTAGGSFLNAFQDSTNNETDAFQILIGGAGTAVASSFTTSAADRWQVVIVAYAPELEPAPLLHPPLLGRGRKMPISTFTPAAIAASGTLFQQTLAVTATFTPALAFLSIYSRTLAVASTFTPAMSLFKSFFRTLAVSSTFTPAMSLFKSFFRTLAVSSTFTPSLVFGRVLLRTLAVTSTFTPAMTELLIWSRTLAVSSTFTPALIKLPNKVLAVGSTFAPALVREMFKVLAVSSTFTAALAAGRFFSRTLAVSSVTTVALVRLPNKVLATSNSWTVNLRRLVAKTLPVASTFSPSLTVLRQFFRTLAVGSTFTSAMSRVRVKVLAVATTWVVGLVTFVTHIAVSVAYWTKTVNVPFSDIIRQVVLGLPAIIRQQLNMAPSITRSTTMPMPTLTNVKTVPYSK